MATKIRPLDRNEFEVAIICALQVEFDAVDALIDENWESEKSYGKARGDPNAYRIGSIGEHNVVVATLPEMGRRSSATAAAWLSASFPNIKLGLVVGICGAIPWNPVSSEHITLGDITVSTGLVQYDYGRQYSDGVRRKDMLENNLARPTTEIRSFLRILESRKSKRLMQERTALFLDCMFKESEFEPWRYPGIAQDKLYDQNYRHKHQDPSVCQICAKCTTDADPVCDVAIESSCTLLGCSDQNLVVRDHGRLEIQSDPNGATFKPALHFGRIASGDLVMKSAYHRDQIASKERVIAFEMEGAGVWEAFPTIIIKSVCDYADSHKNKIWQQFAAATAAACTKAFLIEWRMEDTPQRVSALNIDKGRADAVESKSNTTDLPIAASENKLAQHSSRKADDTNGSTASVEGRGKPVVTLFRGLSKFVAGKVEKPGARLYKGLSIFEAAKLGTPGFIESLASSDIAIKNERGWTLLHCAASGNQVAIGDRLHALGLPLGVDDDKGITPMHIAAANGHIEMVDFLRSHGASTSVADKEGWTSMHYAARYGDVAMGDHLLSLGEDIAVKSNSGMTPIHSAAYDGRNAMVERLQARGADPAARDNRGWAPIRYAVKGGHIDTVNTLLSLGQNVDDKDSSGRTPIFIAAEQGDIAMVDHLYSLGQDIHVEDNRGVTPLQAAEKAGKNKMALHLRHLDGKRSYSFK